MTNAERIGQTTKTYWVNRALTAETRFAAAEAKLAEAERSKEAMLREAHQSIVELRDQVAAVETREKALAKRTAQVLDAFERRRMGFPLGYEEETVIVELTRAALSAREDAP